MHHGNVYVTMMLLLMEIKEYVRVDGTSPFQKWFNHLDAQAAAKVTVAIARLEQGNTSNIKWFKGLGGISNQLGTRM